MTHGQPPAPPARPLPENVTRQCGPAAMAGSGNNDRRAIKSGNNDTTPPRDTPTDDSWTATSTTSAPAAREYHTAVWTGSEMIVWGGFNGSFLNTGGRYNPGTDSWTATSITSAPAGRYEHTAVWTGSEMIVWGGLDCDGRYHYFSNAAR